MVTIIRRVKLKCLYATYTTQSNVKKLGNEIEIMRQKFTCDEWTNITPKIISKIGCNLHTTQYHPLSHIRQRIVDYFYSHYKNKCGNPIFSVYDNLSPIVTVAQNFDSLLIAQDHSSRKKSDCYYINEKTLLRAHTTAHQAELVAMGLDNFLVIGDVYRRDEIDATHYPAFHQVDAVRLCTIDEVFKDVHDSETLRLFENQGKESPDKQAVHTLEAVKIMEYQLKNDLIGLARVLFGDGNILCIVLIAIIKLT